MANWNVWEPAYRQLTLANDGDDLERTFEHCYGLTKDFPNYEEFWRYHVAPATNRPVDIDHRPTLDPVIGRLITLHHSVLDDLYQSKRCLEKMRIGDYGYRQRNFKDCIKYGGDTLQKFSDLQRYSIEEELSKRLSTKIQVWSTHDWSRKWKPWREQIANYRHYLTHGASSPKIFVQIQQEKKESAYVLKKDAFASGTYPTWNEQGALFQSNPALFAEVVQVCDEYYSETVKWLNAAYSEVIQFMKPLLTNPSYHQLWGWDRPSHPMGSGCGYVTMTSTGSITSDS